jgi:hypothetical protein
MKNIFQIVMLATILIIVPFTMLAQPPHPPGGGHGSTENNPVPNAPVGEGMLLLLGLAGLYGAKKTIDFRKAVKEKKT